MSDSSIKQAVRNPVYDAARQQLAATLTPHMIGNPAATVAAILKVVDTKEPPLRLILLLAPYDPAGLCRPHQSLGSVGRRIKGGTMYDCLILEPSVWPLSKLQHGGPTGPLAVTGRRGIAQ